MQDPDVAGRWDEEYRSGRYVREAPVAFVADIARAARRHRPAHDLRLYIGCGNGRNYIPLVEAGLDLVGLDVSAAAISQLAKLRPERASRLIHGDLGSLPTGSQFGTVVAIQVLQHGGEAEAHWQVRPEGGTASSTSSRAESLSVSRATSSRLCLCAATATHRQPPARGHWDQWEGIWRAPAQLS
jgi:2-polyprenyl-3-methyl-5-hydroxy-6-metoxy-1,4-benzoquinol methylase